MQTIPQRDNPSERVFVSVRLPKDIDRAVEKEATNRDISKQQLIEEAIRQYLGLEPAA